MERTARISTALRRPARLGCAQDRQGVQDPLAEVRRRKRPCLAATPRPRLDDARSLREDRSERISHAPGRGGKADAVAAAAAHTLGRGLSARRRAAFGGGCRPANAERDLFIVLLVNEVFLRDVVVSRDDILKHALAALAAGARRTRRRNRTVQSRTTSRLALPLADRMAENREQADIIAEFLFWSIPRKTLIKARRDVRFRGKSGHPKKPGK